MTLSQKPRKLLKWVASQSRMNYWNGTEWTFYFRTVEICRTFTLAISDFWTRTKPQICLSLRSVCLSVCLSTQLSIYLATYLFSYLSICLSVSVCLSVCLSVRPSIHPSFFPSIFLSIQLISSYLSLTLLPLLPQVRSQYNTMCLHHVQSYLRLSQHRHGRFHSTRRHRKGENVREPLAGGQRELWTMSG